MMRKTAWLSELRGCYRESVWLAWWACVLLIAATVLPMSIVLIQSLLELPSWWNSAPAPVLLIFSLVFGLVFINFGRLTITVDSQNIKVRYGVIKETISLNDVVSCEPTRADPSTYLGVGIRIGADNSLAFTTSCGKAIRIMRRNGRPFVFSTNNPGELSKIIDESSKSTHRGSLSS